MTSPAATCASRAGSGSRSSRTGRRRRTGRGTAEPGTLRTVRKPSLSWLVILAPAAVVLRVLDQDLAVFLTSAGAVIPLAGLIGRATDQLAIRAGPRTGGLLNATFGNVTELIIALFLVLDDEIPVVKA